MDDPRLFAILFAGVCSGAILGVTIPTETERKIRQGSTGWSLGTTGSLTRVVFVNIFKMILVLSVFTGVGILILNVTGAYPLCQPYDKQILTWSWLGGAAIAKWGRYLYWKRQDQWL